MKKIIINKTERVIILGAIKLLPGANEVEPHFLDKKNSHHSMIMSKVEDACLEVPSAEVEDDFADDILGQYNVADAVKLIKETNDYDTLRSY